jgi:hypothetical protein
LGYEDANDCGFLKGDPALKIAVGRDPVDDPDLASQPTMCRLEASSRGVDPRFVVTNLGIGAKAIYEGIYCPRGAMELLIKEHSRHLKSDGTSCHKFEANQFRLFLHCAANNLMPALPANLLKGTELARAQFDTIRLRLLKIVARVQVLKTKIIFHLPLSLPVKPILTRCTLILNALPEVRPG